VPVGIFCRADFARRTISADLAGVGALENHCLWDGTLPAASAVTSIAESVAMSLFGAINTAISGLGAQSAAFGNISDDIANSQSTGFKRIDTTFEDYLTTSTPTQNQPGAVVAHPEYVNNVQGSVSQTDNPLALAITGQGFFAVSQATGQSTSSASTPTFDTQQYYTRDGNFTMSSSGFLVNDVGQYLNGWTVNPTTGAVDQNALAPIEVTQRSYNPVASANVNLSANLPATPASGTATATSPLSSQITVYDALGTAHTVSLNWSETSANNWSVQISIPDSTTGTTDAGTANVSFGSASGNAVPEGTIGSIQASTTDPGTVTSTGYAAGQPATLQFTTNFGSGSQTINLNIGTYGSAQGVTQYAGTTYNLLGLTQDGVPPGSFSGVTMQTNGDVIANYNNGQTRTIAQIPLITFNAPDQLQRQNGQAFTATLTSGTPLANSAGVNGAGNLVTSAVEGSNVDIATEFSDLIVAQQAYSANAKVVTSGNQMLQTTLSMLT
jgi:flagellar hook protein FlgE